jgi:hypothetical protein
VVPRALAGAGAVSDGSREKPHGDILAHLFDDEQEVQRLEEQGGVTQRTRLGQCIEIEPRAGVPPGHGAVRPSLERLVRTELIYDAKHGRRSCQSPQVPWTKGGERVIGKVHRDAGLAELRAREARSRHVAVLANALTRSRRQNHIGAVKQGVLSAE